VFRLSSGSRRVRLFSALFVLALVVYIPRAYRTLAVIGDSAELATAAAVWGVPHPPGYPLYTLVAHLFTWLPLGELAFRVHLASTLFHATAVGLVACTIDVITGSLAAAAIGALTLALSRVFFLGSLYAEVFPLNDVFFAASLLLGVQVLGSAHQPEPAPPFRALALVVGFGTAHHPMFALAVPALATLVGVPVGRHLRRHPRESLLLLGLAVLPTLAFYALVPVAASRDPYVSWGDVHDLRSLWLLATRQDYGGLFHASRRLAEGQLLERFDALASATGASFGVLGVPLALLGLAVIWTGERRMSAALLLAVLVPGPLLAALNAFDIHSEYRIAFFERFVTMCHVPLAILVGSGFAGIETRLAVANERGRRWRALALVALSAATVGPLVPNLAAFDMSHNRLAIAYAHDLVLSTPDDSLVLLKGDMPNQAALYLCGVERSCGGRIIFSPGQLFMSWRVDQLSRRYPELSLPREGDAPTALRRLVEQELARRPVFVHPELLDDAQGGEQAALPVGLLFRLYSNDVALRADLPVFQQELAANVRNERCEGCLQLRTAPNRLPVDSQLVRVYKSALAAKLIAARELGFTREADALSAGLPSGAH